MKKTVSLLLAIVLCLSVFTVGMAEEYGYETNKLADGTQQLSLMGYQNWDSAAYYDSDEGLLIENVLEDITGVDIKWECYSSDDYDTIAQTRLAAGLNLPDIMRVPVVTGAVTKYADEGLFLNFSDYISEETTPNIINRLKDPYIAAITTAPDGNIYALPYCEAGTNEVAVDWVTIRKDWLDKLGLEMPKTVQEYHDALLAIKEKDPNGNGIQDEIPLGYQNNGMFGLYCFKGFFGLSYGTDMWSVDENGKVQLDLVDPRLKDMYSMLADWYKEGLLYTDVSNTGREELLAQNMLGGQTLLAQDNVLTNQGITYDADPNAAFVYIPLLDNDGYYNGKTVEESKKQLDKRSNAYWGYYTITTDCKNPELAVRWMDYVWGSPESEDLRYWGIEGVTYDVVDGEKVFHDNIINSPKGAISEMRALGGWPNFVNWESGEAYVGMFKGTYAEKAADEFMPYMRDQVPVLLGTEEENDTYLRYWMDLETFIKESTIGFITGTKPIDEWDSYVATCYDMHLEDVLKVRQAWWDRYQSFVK